MLEMRRGLAQDTVNNAHTVRSEILQCINPIQEWAEGKVLRLMFNGGIDQFFCPCLDTAVPGRY